MPKKALLVIGLVVAGLGLALVVLGIVGLDPEERRPGLWLRGQLVSGPVAHWSFTDKYPNIHVQTRTVALVTDPAEKDAVLATKARKYPRQRAVDKSFVHVFRVQSS